MFVKAELAGLVGWSGVGVWVCGAESTLSVESEVGSSLAELGNVAGVEVCVPPELLKVVCGAEPTLTVDVEAVAPDLTVAIDVELLGLGASDFDDVDELDVDASADCSADCVEAASDVAPARDAAESESADDEPDPVSSALAIPGGAATATPTPSAIASAPTRPM